MKSLSRIIIFMLSVILAFTMTAAQILYCLHSTFMSPQHLSKLLEDDQNLTELTNILYRGLAIPSINNPNETFIRQYMAKTLRSTDQAWVRSQTYITIKGVHQYVFSEASTLPTLDIIPFKKALKSVIVAEIMKSDEARQKTEKIKTILSTLNNKYFAGIIALGLDSRLASMLLELAPIRSTGFDKASLNEIIRAYISLSNKSITLEQASTTIAEQMTADLLRLNEIKDYFDLDLFMDKAFDQLNPLKIYKAFISSMDKTATRTINVLLWCILLLLAIHKRFHLSSIVKAAASCFLTSSILVLCVSALLINKPLVEELLSHIYNTQGPLAYITTKYFSLLSRDLGMYLALQGLVTALPCAVLLFFTTRIKRTDKKEKEPRRFPVIRLSLVLFALLAVFLVVSFMSFSNEYTAFRENLRKLSQTDLSQSMKKGLVEAGGMEFMNMIKSNEKKLSK